MEPSGRPKRKYQSGRRKEQAQETRQKILTAALKLFAEHGYAGATIEAIAQEAGVAALTIFSIFGNKRSILAGLVAVSVGGDVRPIPLLERPGPRAVLEETDPVRQISLFAADISNILERVSPVFEIMRMAAKTEPEIAVMLNGILEARMNNLGVFVRRVSAQHALREGLGDTRATEIVWSIASPEVFRLLTQDRGWSKAQFSQWLGETLVRLLLP
jgi:AcrR family transcriptional regulator